MRPCMPARCRRVARHVERCLMFIEGAAILQYVVQERELPQCAATLSMTDEYTTTRHARR